MPPPDEKGVRLDKWLWAARFFKTRSLAQKAVEGGKVHVNGDRCKSGRLIREGLCIRVRQGTEIRDVIVHGLAEKRGPAKMAQSLYEETEDSVKAREKASVERKAAAMAEPTFGGRPDKRQRRQIEKLLRQNRER